LSRADRKTIYFRLESAAGVAGITKVLLMMKYGKMVKSLHFERSNPKINFPKYNMEVSTDVADDHQQEYQYLQNEY
jgi:acyl transferase domain-containing protein